MELEGLQHHRAAFEGAEHHGGLIIVFGTLDVLHLQAVQIQNHTALSNKYSATVTSA